jgi:hypothetical protein
MRFFFDVRKPVTNYDYDGCEFDSIADAVIAAKELAQALRERQAVPQHAMKIAVMHESGALVHEETVFAGGREYSRRARRFIQATRFA